MLIKSTLNNQPVYWLSAFRSPTAIISFIDKIRRSFFWKELDNQTSPTRKLHTIIWQTVCQSKLGGGLGLGFIDIKNEALLAKWWWKFSKEKGRLWREILVGKYGEDCLNVLRTAWRDGRSIPMSPVVRSIVSLSN